MARRPQTSGDRHEQTLHSTPPSIAKGEKNPRKKAAAGQCSRPAAGRRDSSQCSHRSLAPANSNRSLLQALIFCIVSFFFFFTFLDEVDLTRPSGTSRHFPLRRLPRPVIQIRLWFRGADTTYCDASFYGDTQRRRLMHDSQPSSGRAAAARQTCDATQAPASEPVQQRPQRPAASELEPHAWDCSISLGTAESILRWGISVAIHQSRGRPLTGDGPRRLSNLTSIPSHPAPSQRLPCI